VPTVVMLMIGIAGFPITMRVVWWTILDFVLIKAIDKGLYRIFDFLFSHHALIELLHILRLRLVLQLTSIQWLQFQLRPQLAKMLYAIQGNKHQSYLLEGRVYGDDPPDPITMLYLG
jgi:hypothetical protein